MKDYFINLGGRDRRLEYTLDDRKSIERAFSRPDGQPGNLYQLMHENGFISFSRSGSIDVQITVLWAGLRHEKPIAQEQVEEWVRQHLKERKHIVELLAPATAAILESGILGFVREIPEPEETVEKGKVPPVPAPPAAIVPEA